MSENPEKVLNGLKTAEKLIRRVQRDIAELGWRIQTFRRLYELNLVPSMSISQKEEVFQFIPTLRSILSYTQMIVIGVDALEKQTLGIASIAEKGFKKEPFTRTD